MRPRFTKARGASTGAAGAVIAVLIDQSRNPSPGPDGIVFWAGVVAAGALIGIAFAMVVSRWGGKA